MAPLNDLFSKVPQASNSTDSTQLLYDERKYYYDKVYPNPSDGLPWMDKPFDFVNENPLYGRVDLKGELLIPKHKMINRVAQYDNHGQIKETSFNVSAFNFVADAYNDLRINIMSLISTGYLSKEGPIAKFEAKKGFVDFQPINKQQKELHYFMFVTHYLLQPTSANSGIKYKEVIGNAYDFTSIFSSYLKSHAKTVPFTQSSIFNAFYMSPLATGLCIEIDDKPYDDDQKKHEFLKDPNFNIYRIAARRFGFMVDRNVPWRLVADVRSYKMREYMRMAYEKKMIEDKTSAYLKSRGEEVRAIFPDLPRLEDLFEFKGGVWKKKDYQIFLPSEFEGLRETTEKGLRAILDSITEETKGLMEPKDMYGAKDPVLNDEGLPICVGDDFKLCSSRIMQFGKFFETFYDVPYLEEVSELKKTFYKFFISYRIQNPVVRKKIICTDTNLQTKFSIKETAIQTATEEQYNEYYSKFYWMKMYFDIKLKENNIKLTHKKYDFHLQKILNISTLNDGNTNNLSGKTTENSNHSHDYHVDIDGNGWALMVVHPTMPNVKHRHEIKNWIVQEAHSECYPECAHGVGHHGHDINNDFILGLKYINRVVRKRTKGLNQIYGKKGKIKEENIGKMIVAISQKNTNLFPGSY